MFETKVEKYCMQMKNVKEKQKFKSNSHEMPKISFCIHIHIAKLPHLSASRIRRSENVPKIASFQMTNNAKNQQE